MKKGNSFDFLLVLLVAALGLTSGVSYYFEKENFNSSSYEVSKEPTLPRGVDPTRDWKSTVNEKYNFSIKYPKEWQRIQSLEKGNTIFYAGPQGITGSKNLPNGLQILVQKLPNDLTSSGYANKIVSQNSLSTDFKIYPSDFTEYDVTIVEGLKTNPSPTAFVKSEGVILELRSHDLLPNKDNQIFKQILYTFRLITN